MELPQRGLRGDERVQVGADGTAGFVIFVAGGFESCEEFGELSFCGEDPVGFEICVCDLGIFGEGPTNLITRQASTLSSQELYFCCRKNHLKDLSRHQ